MLPMPKRKLTDLMGEEGAEGAPPGVSDLPADSDTLSTEDLAGLAGAEGGEGMAMDPGMQPGMEPGLEGGIDPEEIELQELQAALEDPNTPPEMQQMIQQRLAMAARRRMAGVGGGEAV